jgi:hypothetical protein
MLSVQRLLIFTAGIGILLGTLWFGAYTSSWAAPSLDFTRLGGRSDRHFHLVLPATASNLNLCRLLLSGAVTGYPEPVLVGWEGHGLYDGAQSHLFKISETLAYLTSLPPSADEDLVLLLDAYDVWMQLRPDVLISRYFHVIEKANQRLKDEGIYGVQHGGSDVRQSLLFGADKTCWPGDAQRPACWSVTPSPLSDIAFGPRTDEDMIMARPKWLNSGSIIGPVKDMRDMFEGTMEQVRHGFDESYEFRNSDQYYFQNMWAEQEVGRLLLKNSSFTPPELGIDDTTGQMKYGHMPDFSDGHRTEYHVSLDHETDIFQTSAAYTEFMTWMSFNHGTAPRTGSPAQHRLDQLTLPADIAQSPPPFAQIDSDPTLPPRHDWADLMLGMNAITKTIFPIFHMTGDKTYRDRWWSRMWFQPYGKELLSAVTNEDLALYQGEKNLIASASGVKWYHPTVFNANDTSSLGTLSRAGAWSDQGVRLSWEDLCLEHEGALFEQK